MDEALARSQEAAEARLRALEERMELLAGESALGAADEARRLADFERQIWDALPEIAQADEGVAAQAALPLLADAARWRDLAEEFGADEAARAADDFVAGLVGDATAGWIARAELLEAEGDPAACFQALAEARVLDLEALARRRGPEAPLAPVRPRLRAALERACREQAPGVELRDAWTKELLDRADVVLTSIDDLEPERARPLLALAADDLTWHARHIEGAMSRRRGRLRAKVRRIRAEEQERNLQHRLEQRFGARFVASFERIILWLILLVLILLGVEMHFHLDAEARFWLAIVDTAACAVFLLEFFVKLAMVRGKGRWFLRHFFVDLLPSIPFGLLQAPTADAVRAGRAIRFLRLPRLARYLRALRPLIRVVRALGFLMRGIDRVARKYGHLLNRDIVLYPTREERAAATREREGLGPRLRRLQADLDDRWELVLTMAPKGRREEVAAARVRELEAARAAGRLRFGQAPELASPPTRDILAEDLVERLTTLTPEELVARTGLDFVSRAARAVRLFSRRPLRWLPVLRKYMPRLNPGMGDAEVVVAAARRAGARFRRNLERWFGMADLYGTITPAQFVDRVGSAMVKGAFRPAYRLTLFGLFYLLVVGLLEIADDVQMLHDLRQALQRLVGTTLIVLGSICFAILGLGWWLRRIAGQASDFFAQMAKAQYLSLTEAIKSRQVGRDAAILDARVFSPERILFGRLAVRPDRERFEASVRGWLLEVQAGATGTAGFDHVERAVLVYRDGLDGALLADSDTRTTIQLLGDPALRNMCVLSHRFTGQADRELRRIDLERQKSLFGGPYLWFSLVSQAVAHGVARLIVDYNRFCLPTDQRERATEEERLRFRSWLGAERVADVTSSDALYVTTDFHALHFLDDDPRRDEDVSVRYGGEVLERLRRDRRHLFRRVFGTYPLHLRPHGERVINAYRIYTARVAGGRALLLPFVGLWALLVSLRRFLRWLLYSVGQVRNPSFDVDENAMRGADLRTALRKIQRMRAPVAEASIRLRSMFDPEYLGLRLPGCERSGLEDALVDDDLRFLGATPEYRDEIDSHRRRATHDLLRLGRLLDNDLKTRLAAGGTFSREHLQAAAMIYVGDMDGVRSLLSAPEILSAVYERAASGDLLPGFRLPRIALHRLFRRWWRAHGEGDGEARRAAWRATLHNVDGAADALRAWCRHGDDARAEGERRFARLLRHPERFTDQIVTLRAVQSLSLIDVLTYREHVFRLGEYAALGDDLGDAARLGSRQHDQSRAAPPADG